jgi:N utilization substance protein B
LSIHFGGRSLARSQALQLLFQAEANLRSVEEVLAGEYALSEGPLDEYARTLALGADARRHDLDAIISQRSTRWALGRMNAVDRNLLRLALYEMLDVDEVDVAVTIDECVELAKAYGTDESSRFVNGLLGRVADDLDAGADVVAGARAALAARAADRGREEGPEEGREPAYDDEAYERDAFVDDSELIDASHGGEEL